MFSVIFWWSCWGQSKRKLCEVVLSFFLCHRAHGSAGFGHFSDPLKAFVFSAQNNNLFWPMTLFSFFSVHFCWVAFIGEGVCRMAENISNFYLFFYCFSLCVFFHSQEGDCDVHNRISFLFCKPSLSPHKANKRRTRAPNLRPKCKHRKYAL